MRKVEHYKAQNLLSCKKMDKKIKTFIDTAIENRKFHHRQNLILSEDVVIKITGI